MRVSCVFVMCVSVAFAIFISLFSWVSDLTRTKAAGNEHKKYDMSKAALRTAFWNMRAWVKRPSILVHVLLTVPGPCYVHCRLSAP